MAILKTPPDSYIVSQPIPVTSIFKVSPILHVAINFQLCSMFLFKIFLFIVSKNLFRNSMFLFLFV